MKTMSKKAASHRHRKFAWMRTGFDLEGIGGAAAGILVGLLFGWIWGPLFWIGVILAAVILIATRSEVRVTPEMENIVVAPCDGMVYSVERAVPPIELRLSGGDWLRVRISSSPFSTNPVYASIGGEITSLIEEEPDASRLVASRADDAGLATAHVTLAKAGRKIGYTIITGGLGPRLDMIVEAGDPVRAGRVLGKRRLGGWCDLYVAHGTKLLVSEGQTLIGGETVLCRLVVDGQNVEEGTIDKRAKSVETASVLSAHETISNVDDDAAAEPNDAIKDEANEVAEETTSLAELGEQQAAHSEQQISGATDLQTEPDDFDDPDEVVAALFKKLKDNEGKT